MTQLARRGLRELEPSPVTPTLVVMVDEHAELVARCAKPALEARPRDARVSTDPVDA
jgi:hypothetical protein